ncbi:hypothetical protein, partial [Candidatus Ichthyocystis sparus]|uniref:hypothetical protein n=1 Tax=Candidatus Ichthyocystis sparus TaxID=1561004 RepID=UPI00159EC1B0
PVLEDLDLAEGMEVDNDHIGENNNNPAVEGAAGPEPGMILEEDDSDDDGSVENSSDDSSVEDNDIVDFAAEDVGNGGPVLEDLDLAEGMEVDNDHIGENNNNPAVEGAAGPEPGMILEEDDSDDDGSVENSSDDSSVEDNDIVDFAAEDVGNGGPVLVDLDLVAGIENNNDPVEEGAAGPEPDVIPELLFDFDRIFFVVRNLGRPDVVPDYVVRLNNNAPQVDEEPQIDEEPQVVDEDVVLPDIIPH